MKLTWREYDFPAEKVITEENAHAFSRACANYGIFKVIALPGARQYKDGTQEYSVRLSYTAPGNFFPDGSITLIRRVRGFLLDAIRAAENLLSENSNEIHHNQ